MDIRFNTKMKTKDLNISMLNETLIDIYIMPAGDRASLLSFNISQLNITWKVLSYEEDLLKIKLTFSNFAEVSPL